MVLAPVRGEGVEEEEGQVKDDAPIVGENLRPPRETKNAVLFC